YPLAVPAIAGPGTMLTVMLLTDNGRFSVSQQAMTTVVVVAVLLVQYVLLLAAQPVSRLIGKGGANVIRRVMGMVLASVAVNAVLTATRPAQAVSPKEKGALSPRPPCFCGVG